LATKRGAERHDPDTHRKHSLRNETDGNDRAPTSNALLYIKD
jgi:hypothetical protein